MVMRLGAGLDPAVTLNACALAVVGEVRPGLWAPLVLRTWQGRRGAPLELRNQVAPEAAELVKRAGLSSWMTDIFGFWDVQHASREAGLLVQKDDAQLVVSFGTTRRLLHARPTTRLVLRSDDPELDERCALVAKQLGTVLLKRRGASSEIILPTIAGAHGDLARALVRALWHAKAGDDAKPYDPTAWEMANRGMVCHRSAHAPTQTIQEQPTLFLHARARR